MPHEKGVPTSPNTGNEEEKEKRYK